MAIEELSRHQPQTRIFLLTDGQVENRDQVIQKCLTGRDSVRVYTFGLGSGCDVDMVKRAARNGRGTCSLVIDNETNLNGLVIAALAHAF
jgi:hypothetical protein